MRSTDNKKNLGNLIRIARIHNGLTQEELASKTSTTKSRISKMENGMDGFKIKTVMEVLMALNCKNFCMEVDFGDSSDKLIIPLI